MAYGRFDSIPTWIQVRKTDLIGRTFEVRIRTTNERRSSVAVVSYDIVNYSGRFWTTASVILLEMLVFSSRRVFILPSSSIFLLIRLFCILMISQVVCRNVFLWFEIRIWRNTLILGRQPRSSGCLDSGHDHFVLLLELSIGLPKFIPRNDRPSVYRAPVYASVLGLAFRHSNRIPIGIRDTASSDSEWLVVHEENERLLAHQAYVYQFQHLKTRRFWPLAGYLDLMNVTA